jgi:hypothetical protein
MTTGKHKKADFTLTVETFTNPDNLCLVTSLSAVWAFSSFPTASLTSRWPPGLRMRINSPRISSVWMTQAGDRIPDKMASKLEALWEAEKTRDFLKKYQNDSLHVFTAGLIYRSGHSL